MQKTGPESSLWIIKLCICAAPATHSGPTGWLLGLLSWKESSHFEVLPLGYLRSSDLKEVPGISHKRKKKKKIRTSTERSQVVYYSWNSTTGRFYFNCVELGHQICSLLAPGMKNKSQTWLFRLQCHSLKNTIVSGYVQMEPATR